MDVNEMTPEQLRAFAAEKERAHDNIVNMYMDVPRSSSVRDEAPEPWEKDVEFEGEVYRIDMRRLKSRRFFELFGRVQKGMERDRGADVADMMELFSFLFYNIDDKVERIAIEKCGYDDFEEIYRIETALFEAVQAKN